MSNKILLVTLGDPNGIGPEVVAKSVPRAARCAPVVLIGSLRALMLAAPALVRRCRPIEKGVLLSSRASLPDGLYQIDPASAGFRPQPGRMTAQAARSAFDAFCLAVEILASDPARFSLVTAPMSKEACMRAGIRFSGHTGYLGEIFGVKPLMLLMAGAVRVALVTEHIPISRVPDRVTAAAVLRALTTLASGLADLGVTRRPRIAVLGLNPHAGEGGRIGTEDSRIDRAIRAFNRTRRGVAMGPLPADSAFSPESVRRLHPHAFLAMYHDQGLIPVKRAGLHLAVNITLGLPARRTSPAHGTAYDIAGRRIADPRSMRLAIDWALR